MNRDEITRKTSELSTIAHTTEDSKVEYWYARELMTYMGYDRWENFSKAITRAKQACSCARCLAQMWSARRRARSQCVDCMVSPSRDMSR